MQKDNSVNFKQQFTPQKFRICQIVINVMALDLNYKYY